MISSQYQFLFVVIFLAVYICNASNNAPKLQTYKSCENAYENQFLPRNCPVGYDYTLQILCIFFLCEEAKKILNSLQRNEEIAKENFTYENHF